jgi:TonB family protein
VDPTAAVRPDEPDTTPKPEEKQDQDKPSELPKPAPAKPKIDFPEEMGERTGKGIGSNKSEGIEPLKALEADEDQAFLSRNPGAAGREANRPSGWLMSPGENGRGGHPGPATPSGAARLPSDSVPVPADPLAMQAPRPQESNPDSDATPLPAPPDLPVPQVQPETTADNTAEPAEPPHSPPALAVVLQPAQQVTVPPEAADDLKLSNVSVGPKIAPTPPKPGDDASKGAGHAGVEDDLIATENELTSRLRRTTTQPSREAGHADGAPVALQVAVPFIAPTRVAEPKLPQPAKPAFALLVPPPTASMPDPAPPTLQQPPPDHSPVKEKPDVSKPAPRRPPPTPVAPSLPAPAAGTSASAQATGDGRQPGTQRPSGDPGQMSDSESDPFSKIGSAQVLRDGKLDVRFGRKIKTVRPHIPVVGQVDSFALLNPSVTLKVNIDTTGKVTEVAIQKSSGSNEIDQPTLIAMYDWWFEPLHDSKGNAVADCVLFTINFR